jgi:predicted transcriptional regulator
MVSIYLPGAGGPKLETKPTNYMSSTTLSSSSLAVAASSRMRRQRRNAVSRATESDWDMSSQSDPASFTSTSSLLNVLSCTEVSPGESLSYTGRRSEREDEVHYA